MYRYYYNSDYTYSHSVYLPQDITDTPAGLFSTLVVPTFESGHWPVWDPDGGVWGQVEDHRGELVWVDGVAVTITDFGPLPEGASLTPPGELPDDEKLKLQQINEKKAELMMLDYQSIRPLRVIENGTATQADHDKLAELESLAVIKRGELAELEGSNG
jgi:hypothetical protein